MAENLCKLSSLNHTLAVGTGHRWARSDPQAGGGGSRQGVGDQNRFSKNLLFKRFAAKFLSKVPRRFSEGQKGIV